MPSETAHLPFLDKFAFVPDVHRVTRHIDILRSQAHPFKFVISRLLMRTGLCRHLSIPQRGFRLRFFPTSLSAALWINPNDRKDDVAFFSDFLRRGDIVVDVGANIGSLSLLAAVITGDEGKVLAVEPHPRIFRFQQENLALNSRQRVEAHNVALGDSDGSLRFSDERADDQNGVLNDEDGGIVIPVTTLDRLAKDLPRVTLLKIDVEGYEMAVLAGASATLERTECVFYESWEEHLKKWDVSSGTIIARLEQAGFEVYQGIKQRHLKRVSTDYKSLTCEDLVAVRTVSVIQNRMKCTIE